MSSSVRVALVTGANQGIGFEIVRQLCKKFDGKVLLAARNAERGQEAVRTLQGEGLSPEFLLLDVDSEDSIRSAKDEVKKKYGRLDVLINNAGVLIDPGQGVSFQESVSRTIKTNYHGLRIVTNNFLSLLQPNSRVIHVSSGLGSINHISKQWQEQVLFPDLTEERLSEIMDQFVRDANSPDYASKGWPPADAQYASYRVSKIGVTRLTQLHAKTLASDFQRPGILVNAICPGWVRTRMGTAAGRRSTEQGADTPVWLALLPPGTAEPNGEFLRDRKPANWHVEYQPWLE